MNKLKLIMFLCILTQGCSLGSHEQINQPVSAIYALEAAPLATLSSEQIINPDIDGASRLQIDADEVIYENGESVEEAESDGSIESASDNTDFLPKPPSYWM
ncbi:MAG: hypothetical protein ACI88H_004206 [Cocleimonas sp.]|jgi:hypothetical protein